ncbi:MAG: DoxX family protein [Betaproteobacteria bacterium]|nr:DoxX family protein [Betaproteobacteria bacterium]MBI2962076.1 DoxX family protein [Betaproteobacteria bacterium]
MTALQRYLPLAGRLLLALIFVLSGFEKITGFSGTVGYITAKGLPLPQLAAIGAIVFELAGSIMLVLGWKARWGALLLFVFTALATIFFHNFWAVPADQSTNQMIHFMKNLAIMGGLLYVMAYGSGAISLDDEKSA